MVDGSGVSAVIEPGFQTAVGDGQDAALDADDGRGGSGFGSAAAHKGGTLHLVMPRSAVGDAEEADAVPEGRPERRNAAAADLAVVGVGADHEDAQLLGGRCAAVSHIAVYMPRTDASSHRSGIRSSFEPCRFLFLRVSRNTHMGRATCPGERCLTAITGFR